MPPSWLALSRADLPLLAGGAFLTVGAAAAAMRVGGSVSFSAIVALTLFFAVVAGFIAFPHITVAAMIPTFALLPAIKVLAFPSLGPLKDVVTIAAITAMLVLVVQRAGEGSQQRGDFWAAGLVVFLVGLYFVNLGGSLQRDVAWFHGIRLVSQPLLLLLVAMVLPQARRTLRWALASLLATGVFVALVGVAQQLIGADRLIELGYSYTLQVRYIGDRLRSFGTMDESFAYAAFLLLAIVGLLFWARRSIPFYVVGGVLAVGLALAYVRTSVLVILALLGIWLARSHRPTVAAFLLLVAFTAGVAILVWSSNGTESRTVRAGPSLFLTINGRTEGWKLVLESPKTWFIGKGVGEIGTAAERATYSVSRRERDIDDASAVDSGYLAFVADVGFIGLVAFLALVARLYSLARAAVARGLTAGWLAAGFLTVILLDAVTRDSFTGFPTAFLGLFLVGLSLAAAREEIEAADSQARTPAPT
jgi:hypothetical protein